MSLFGKTLVGRGDWVKPCSLSAITWLLHSCAELYHTDMVRVSAPRAAPPPLGGVHTVGQSSSAVSTNNSSSGHHGDGVGGVTGFTASQLPTSSSGRGNKGQSVLIVGDDS